jgi:hypothetical protein
VTEHHVVPEREKLVTSESPLWVTGSCCVKCTLVIEDVTIRGSWLKAYRKLLSYPYHSSVNPNISRWKIK